MAASHASTTTAGNYLKKYYAPNLQYINPEEFFPLWKEIKQSSRQATLKGEGWVTGVKGPFGGGVGGYTEEGDLPDPRFQNAQQGEAYAKGLAASFSITGVLIAKADTDRAAFADGIDEVMNEAETKMMRLQAFTAVSDGTHCLGKITGALTTVAVPGAPANNTFTLDTTATDAPIFALYANMDDEIIAFSDKAGGAATISTAKPRVAIDPTSDSLTRIVTDTDLSGGTAWAAGQYVFLRGARSETATATFNIPNGLDNIIANSGEMAGFNPATSGQEWWKCREINLGAATMPTRALIHTMVRKCTFRNNGRKPTHMLFNPVHAEDLVELYWGRMTEEYKGGKITPGHGDFEDWKLPGARGMKMLEDDFIHPKKFLFPNVKELEILWLRKPEFLDKGDFPAMRIENKDIYKGHLVGWYQMISGMRPAHGRIYNSVDYTAANQIW